MNKSEIHAAAPASAAEERASLSFLGLPAGADDATPCTLAVPIPFDRAEKEGNPARRLGQ